MIDSYRIGKGIRWGLDPRFQPCTGPGLVPHLVASEDYLSTLNFDEKNPNRCGAISPNPILNSVESCPFQVSSLKFPLSAFYCVSLWYGFQIRLVCFMFFNSWSDVILYTMTCPDTHANLMFQPWVDAVIEAETIYQTPLFIIPVVVSVPALAANIIQLYYLDFCSYSAHS